MPAKYLFSSEFETPHRPFSTFIPDRNILS